MPYVYVQQSGPGQYQIGRAKKFELAPSKQNGANFFWWLETEQDILLEMLLQKKFCEYLSAETVGHYVICPTVLSRGIEEVQLFLANYLKAEVDAESLSKNDSNATLRPPTDEAKRLCSELNQVKRKLALLEYEKAFLENQIKSLIGESAGIEGVATWKTSVAIKLDAEAVKSQYPDIYALCLKENRTRRFLLSKEKAP